MKCKCGKPVADDATGEDLGYCQTCWEDFCDQEWWKVWCADREIAELRADRERMDWLEKWLSSRHDNVLTNPIWGVRGYRDVAINHNSACELCGPTLRTALDAARKAGL